MPEERQIGRRICIEGLEKRLISPANQWLIGERRIGKTSVGKAALARLRKRGSLAIDADLSRLEISTPERLAGEIARQAQTARAGDAGATAQGMFDFARRQRGRVRELGKAVQQLGFEDVGQALTAVSAVLAEADDGELGLDKVLGALALHARATERRAYVLLDEVHLLSELDRAEEAVAGWCHAAESPIVFLFAGSEESAAAALREVGRPLAAIGEEFALSDIAPEDWVPGLLARFTEAGVKIGRAELETIIRASDCHPRRTMLISSRVRSSATGQPDATATRTLVELAIQDAEEDRSWR